LIIITKKKSLWERVLKTLYKPIVKRSFYRSLTGRMVEPGSPEKGRLLKHQVKSMISSFWDEMDEIYLSASFETLPSLGNQHNVFLAAITVAAYRVLRKSGLLKDYALDLMGDLGWQVYISIVGVPKFIVKLIARSPQKRIDLVLRSLMRFPFSPTVRPCYEVKAWSDGNAMYTHWTWCPPYQFVKKYVYEHGDDGEIELFRRTWCEYDWALAYALVDGAYGEMGYYERPHTLSHGDEVCDMCWSANPQTKAFRVLGTPWVGSRGK
jgi:hypothetical protein